VAGCSGGKCVYTCDLGFVDSDTTKDGCEGSDFLLWLDASAITGVDDGKAVAQWDDLSGKGHHAKQTDGLAQPLLYKTAANGKPAVHFDGAVHHLVTDGLQLFDTANAGRTFVVVFRATEISQPRFLLQHRQADCTNSFDLGYHAPGTNGAKFGIFAGGMATCTNGIVTGLGLMQSVVTARIVRVLTTGSSPDNVEMYQGLSKLQVERTGSSWSSSGGYGTNTQPLVIGAIDETGTLTSFTNFHQGEIAEIQIWNKAVDDTGLAAIADYLAKKYP
jgi:hypothetical protein